MTTKTKNETTVKTNENEVKTEIVDVIKTMVGDKTAKQIRGWLSFEHSISDKEATKYLEAAGVTTNRAGYANDFYSSLRSAPMSDEAFAEWVEAGSDNVKRSKAHYDNIRKLANDIHASK